MVHTTRSGKNIKLLVEGNGKGPSSSGTGKMEHLASKVIPSRIWKSKVLEMQSPRTHCTQQVKSAGRPDMLNTTSPLRVSERGKRHILSRSSVSRHSGEVEELNLSEGTKEKCVEQVTMESKEVSISCNGQTVPTKRKRMNGHSFRSLFKVQRERDVMPAIARESKRPKIVPRFSSDSKLLGDKVNRGDCHRQAAEELGEDHAAQAEEVESLHSSEGHNTESLHTDRGAELSHANHVHSLAEEPITALARADTFKASTNGCTISKTFDETESLQEQCSSTETEKIPDLIGSTPTNAEFNSQNGEYRIQREADDSQTTRKLVCATAQSKSFERGKHCFSHNEMLTQLTANDNSSEPSKFLEYWLPVQLSNLQLEQYCYSLLSNIDTLCSYSKKSDPVGVLNENEALLAVRKCCDHAYVFDQYAQPYNKGHSPAEMLDFGIKASGKLHLLDKMLPEMKNQHLKVVIFFQSIDPVANLGNILEDYLGQRFGKNSYERVDTCLKNSKRLDALRRFKGENGPFVLLLENRICSASIKLSSVDCVIIYNSDSNPRNDLRLLQKLSFVSQSKPVRVFRLYSCYTVEELALLTAKQDPNVDNLHSLNSNVKNTLMWGASYLFSRLDEYHASDGQASASDLSHGQLLLNNVVKEFCSIISQNNKMVDTHNSVISKVLQSSGDYITDLPLFGEQKVKYARGDEPQVFWKKLLEGRHPHWRYITGPTPRNRKRVQYFEESPQTPGISNDEAGKKRRKMLNGAVDAISTLSVSESSQVDPSKEGASTIKASNKSLPTSTACQNGEHTGDHASKSSYSLSHDANVEPVEQKSLHIYLKAEMAKVFEVLKLSDDVKHMAGRFLDFIMTELRVSREPATLLQAVQISMCRMAASLLKQEVDENKMLMLAKEHLKFECTEDEATQVYQKMRSLKKMFLQHLERNGIPLSALVSVTGPSNGMENLKTESPTGKKFTEENVVAQQTTAVRDKVVEREVEKVIKELQCKCDMRMSRLTENQEKEIDKFQRDCEEKRAAIEGNYRVSLAVARSVHNTTALAKNRMKIIDDKFAREMEKFNRCKDLKMKEIVEKHEKERSEELKKADYWLASAKLGSFNGAATELEMCASDPRDADNNISDSRDGAGDRQDDTADVNNNNISDSQEDVGNLEDIADGNRKISDSRDDVGDTVVVDTNPINIASRNDICNLADNADVNNKDAPGDDIGNVQDDADANNPQSVASVSGCRVEANEPSNNLNESERIEAPSNVPTTTTDDLVTTEALASSPNKPNEVDNGGDSCEDTVPVVPPTLENHTMDELSLGEHANGCSMEVRESAHSEDVIHDHSPEVDEIELNNTDFLNNDGNNNNEVANKSADEDSGSQEQSLQTGACSDNGGLLLQNQDQVPQDQCSQLLASNELQSNQVQPSEFEAGSPKVDDSTPVIQQSSCEPIRTGNSEPQQCNQGPPSVFEAGSPRVDDSTPVIQQSSREPILAGNSEPPQLPCGNFSFGSDQLPRVESEPSPEVGEAETTAEPVCNAADSQGRVSSGLHVSVDVPNTALDQSQTGLSVTSELPNQAILQPSNVNSIQEPNNMLRHQAHFMSSLNSAIRFPFNPLSKELDRLRHELEQAVKSHEDWKSQQRSDCDKEIREMVAQIRSKYEAKIQQGETSFLRKKNDLEGNQTRVLMNKILAEAFRSKCLDPRPSVSLLMQRAVPPSCYVQQLQNVSMLPTFRSPVGFPSAGQPTPNLPRPRQSSIAGFSPSLQGANHSAALSRGFHTPPMPRSNPTVTTIPSSAPSTATHQPPTLQAMKRSVPGRPPLVNDISGGNLRSGGDIRAMAPHLQRIRPTSVPAASSSPLPSSNLAANMPSASPSVTHVPPQQRTSSPLLPQVVPQPPNLVSSHLSQHKVQAPPQVQPTNAYKNSEPSNRVSPTGNIPRPPLSNRDLDKQPCAVPQNGLPPLPEIGKTFDSIDLSEFGTMGNAAGGTSVVAETTGVADVVCLSDDE